MRFLFFFSLFMIFYVYLGYPALIALIGLIRNRKVKKGLFEPSVTILISAYNEQDVIESTLKNKLNLDYPKERLEIMIISDGSLDRTDEIVRSYEGERVRLIRQEPRAGKTSALNMAIPKTSGEILVFSDANSIYQKDALSHLVQSFSDPNVGYVTGKMIYTDAAGNPIGDGCTTYMAYENALRQLETKLGSIVGVDGGIDAVRKNLYQPMTPDQLPDFVLPLKVVEQGYRVVFEPEAILKEPSLKSQQDEYKMRIRVALRALWALFDMRHLLTFTGSKLFAWQLWSHKVLRYFGFIFLVVVYFSNLSLLSQGFLYKAFFILQNAGCLGAIFSPVLDNSRHRIRPLYLFNYFLLLNLAAAHAFIKFLLGQKQAMWTPRKG
jgi:cellulose synthase/poly-beta-1,6-N-acetylglucosamine synthase-like glycosyltransferase